MPSLFDNPSGIRLFKRALAANEIERLRDIASVAISEGGRVTDKRLKAFLCADGQIVELASQCLGGQAKPVRAVFFDKTAYKNWLTPWHQDRTIPVREKCILPGFSIWSKKAGVDHVEPPIEILQQIVTLKIFLDDCPESSGPIRVALGTHRLGRVKASEAANIAAQHVVRAFVADEGDVWAHSTPILHASSKSTTSARRRILHLDFACCNLPAPLQWIDYT